MNQTISVKLTPHLQEATDNLALNLLSTEPFLNFAQAKARLDADNQASQLLSEFVAAQADLRARQARSSVTRENVERVRALQGSVQANNTIMAFAQAQQAAMEYLREVNQQISSMLGFDFAAWASPSCCG